MRDERVKNPRQTRPQHAVLCLSSRVMLVTSCGLDRGDKFDLSHLLIKESSSECLLRSVVDRSCLSLTDLSFHDPRLQRAKCFLACSIVSIGSGCDVHCRF